MVQLAKNIPRETYSEKIKKGTKKYKKFRIVLFVMETVSKSLKTQAPDFLRNPFATGNWKPLSSTHTASRISKTFLSFSDEIITRL
jgi:hypothetical protein